MRRRRTARGLDEWECGRQPQRPRSLCGQSRQRRPFQSRRLDLSNLSAEVEGGSTKARERRSAGRRAIAIDMGSAEHTTSGADPRVTRNGTYQ